VTKFGRISGEILAAFGYSWKMDRPHTTTKDSERKTRSESDGLYGKMREMRAPTPFYRKNMRWWKGAEAGRIVVVGWAVVDGPDEGADKTVDWRT